MLNRCKATLMNSLLDTDKPVVMVLEGGRPFAIPDMYRRAAAVLLAVSKTFLRLSASSCRMLHKLIY